MQSSKEGNTYDVFVYGTLKRGHGNHRVLGNNAKFICDAKLPGYRMVSFGYFPAIHQQVGSVVYGEVYRIDEATLKACDRLEGYRGEGQPDNMYDRETVLAYTGGTEMIVDVYTMRVSKCENRTVIDTGVFK